MNNIIFELFKEIVFVLSASLTIYNLIDRFFSFKKFH